MEHDSSRSGYHQPRPEPDGPEFSDDTWDDEEPEEDGIDTVPKLNLIWAQAYSQLGQPGAIGARGAIPWHLKEDLQHFKELTVLHPVIMGRRTWESIDPQYRPLSQRDNIVVSRDMGYKAPGASVVDSIDEALHMASQPAIPDDGILRGAIWAIGGAQLYNGLIYRADNIYITDIDVAVEADAFAPDIDDLLQRGVFEVVSDSGWMVPSGQGDIPRYRFRTLHRNDSRYAAE